MALYANERADSVKNIRHSDAEMAQFHGRSILEQQQFRSAQIEAALSEAGHNNRELHAVVGRGSLLPALASGSYVVNQEMLKELRLASRGEHAANLGAFLAYDTRKRPAYKPTWSIRSAWTSGRSMRACRDRRCWSGNVCRMR